MTEPLGTGAARTEGDRNMLTTSSLLSIAVIMMPDLVWLHWTTTQSTDTPLPTFASLNPPTFSGVRSESKVSRIKTAAADATNDRRPNFTMTPARYLG